VSAADWKGDPALAEEDRLDRLESIDLDAEEAALVGALPRWLVDGAAELGSDVFAAEGRRRRGGVRS
jgi:hypothetical protein